MSTKINTPICAALVIAACIVASYFWVHAPKGNKPPVQTTLAPSPTALDVQTQYPDTTNWSMYQNYKLGIGFKFPQYTSAGKTLFVQAGDLLFITNSSSPIFIHRAELKRLTSDSAIIQATEKLLQDNFPPGMIVTRTIRSNADLERLIRFRYGKGCRLGSLQDNTPQNSESAVYNVDIAPVTPSLDGGYFTSSCALNWVLYFKYSPQYQLAASWDIGQESYLHTDACPGIPACSIDQALANSFFFVGPPSADTYIDSVLQPE